MTMEATFSFQNLKFERQENSIFEIDHHIQEQRKKSMREHYANMNNRESKLLSLHSEEDVARQSVTLSKLYKKLARTDSAGDKNVIENSSSNSSDNIEDMYNQML